MNLEEFASTHELEEIKEEFWNMMNVFEENPNWIRDSSSLEYLLSRTAEKVHRSPEFGLSGEPIRYNHEDGVITAKVQVPGRSDGILSVDVSFRQLDSDFQCNKLAELMEESVEEYTTEYFELGRGSYRKIGQVQVPIDYDPDEIDEAVNAVEEFSNKLLPYQPTTVSLENKYSTD